MPEHLVASEQLFFDPFAEEGEEFFDPVGAHEKMWQRYSNKEIKHDYSADKFLADTQAVLLDTQFVGQFREAELIAQRMHLLCGEDHVLQAAFENNEALRGSHLHHDQANEEKKGKSTRGKRRANVKVFTKKKVKRLSGWALLGISTKKP